MNNQLISIIVPIYNEAEAIPRLIDSISENLKSIDYKWELILINDGSVDNSELVIKEQIANNPNIILINFIHNFGQTAAWAAGFDHAKGDILITIDADLQNDPSDIPYMLEQMKTQKADLVMGWRKDRHDVLSRVIFSKIANKLINWIMNTTIKDSGCSLRLIKKSALEGLVLYGEMHRLLPFLLSQSGLKIIQIPVKHHPRTTGKSKYGFERTIKVLLDIVTVKFLTQYQTKPMYMFGSVGISFIFLTFITGIFIIIRRIFWQGSWVSPMLFIMSTFFTVGVMCILMGLLAEIQVRAWFEGSQKKSYIIKKETTRQ